ncbi:MAG: helix-turn-helix transcriptional regulator [Gaiellaceae bacterium]|jgi:transcriptional regulator with XRE-family HTH domain
MRVELGEQLRDARTTRGLSLEAASRAAKISQGYLHKLEAGRVQSPSPRVLQRLSEVLDVSYYRLMQLADYLMPGEGGSPDSGAIEEEEAMTRTDAQPPTNRELARLLETVLRELAEVRNGQKELTRALARKT